MKTLLLGMLFVLPLMAAVSPTQIDVPVYRSYIPIGFDDNDNAQVTVEGMFSDTCYRVGPATAEFVPATRSIHIRQTAYRYGGLCVQMLIPFTQVVNIGFAPPGTFALVDAVSGMNLGDLPVNKSSHAEADDYLYAPIADAFVRTDEVAKTNTLVLTGSFSNRCTILKDVKVSYGKNVIVAQPIAERVVPLNNNTDSCEGKTRFQKHVELKSDLAGMYLLHVRSMEGQAINKMIDIP